MDLNIDTGCLAALITTLKYIQNKRNRPYHKVRRLLQGRDGWISTWEINQTTKEGEWIWRYEGEEEYKIVMQETGAPVRRNINEQWIPRRAEWVGRNTKHEVRVFYNGKQIGKPFYILSYDGGLFMVPFPQFCGRRDTKCSQCDEPNYIPPVLDDDEFERYYPQKKCFYDTDLSFLAAHVLLSPGQQFDMGVDSLQEFCEQRGIEVHKDKNVLNRLFQMNFGKKKDEGPQK